MTVLGSNCLKRCILISQKSQEPNVQLISATSPLIPCWHPFNRSSTASAAPQRQGPAAPRMLCPPAQTLPSRTFCGLLKFSSSFPAGSRTLSSAFSLQASLVPVSG